MVLLETNTPPRVALKGVARTTSAAFMDVFWPRATPSLAGCLVAPVTERNQKQVLVGSAAHTESTVRLSPCRPLSLSDSPGVVDLWSRRRLSVIRSGFSAPLSRGPSPAFILGGGLRSGTHLELVSKLRLVLALDHSQGDRQLVQGDLAYLEWAGPGG